MANPEHVKILQQGVEIWNQWRREQPDVHPDLSEIDIRRAQLPGANLSHANLRTAVLHEANLQGADLEEADLMYLADLTRANLIDANLRRASLIGTILEHSKLCGADLTGSKLILAKLAHADLSRVRDSAMTGNQSRYHWIGEGCRLRVRDFITLQPEQLYVG